LLKIGQGDKIPEARDEEFDEILRAVRSQKLQVLSKMTYQAY
jgi:hypothetical protein